MNRITGVPLSSPGMVNRPGAVGLRDDGRRDQSRWHIVDDKGNVYTAHCMAGEVVVCQSLPASRSA